MKRIVFCLLGLALFLLTGSHMQASTLTERIAWYNQTLTKAYDTVGSRNPNWDDPARKALIEYAQIRAGNKNPDLEASLIGDLVQEAVKAGCDDPMIRYLYCRFAPDHASKPVSYWQDAYRKAAQGLDKSGYAPVLKFYGNNRTANVLKRDEDSWMEVAHYRRAAMKDLAIAVQDKSMPVEDVAEAVDTLLCTIGVNDNQTRDAYSQLQGPLLKNWPQTSTAYFIEGKFNYHFAWQARGSGYANEVTPEGWKGFKEKLEMAEAAYRKAWSLNPKDPHIPAEMIEMAVSQQKDRKEMELWFRRAIQLDTNNYAACVNKLRYLSPKWNGSREDMLAFGHECVASKWGGCVPLVLANAHDESQKMLDPADKTAYWKQPDVWPDIQTAYEKFFRINRHASGEFRHHYARYAFLCGQWHEFNAQIKLIRDNEGAVDTDFFGGEEPFNKMVERANAGSGKN